MGAVGQVPTVVTGRLLACHLVDVAVSTSRSVIGPLSLAYHSSDQRHGTMRSSDACSIASVIVLFSLMAYGQHDDF